MTQRSASNRIEARRHLGEPNQSVERNALSAALNASGVSAGVTAKDVLKDNRITAPVTVRAFPEALGSYSSRNATK
jgi:hypothetical protein